MSASRSRPRKTSRTPQEYPDGIRATPRCPGHLERTHPASNLRSRTPPPTAGICPGGEGRRYLLEDVFDIGGAARLHAEHNMVTPVMDERPSNSAPVLPDVGLSDVVPVGNNVICPSLTA